MELREYQKQLEKTVHDMWAQANINIGLVLPTGAGKMVLLTKILADHVGYAIVIVHRVELVSQLSQALAQWGVYHNIIAQKVSIQNIVNIHMYRFKRTFYNSQSKIYVAGIDTLLRLKPYQNEWMQKISLIIQDEAHHVLKKNKWGKVLQLFPDCKGLYPTATPCRADGNGLGRQSDGVLDILLEGPKMRELIKMGFLTEYLIIVPPNNLDLSDVTISASGDYSPPKLRNAVHRSQITGDVVKHYLKFAKDKLGITFAVDIQSAKEITEDFKNAGVSAELITSKTPDILRAQIMARFRNREILQLVNVDLLGEGVDVPAIEVISMARPTQSYVVYAQQFGRALRPLDGKSKAIIIDHVGNVIRHGLPDDLRRTWSLERMERRARGKQEDVIPLRVCVNPQCLAAYERIKKCCPICGFQPQPISRKSIDHVDGDLIELDAETLAKMRGEIEKIDDLVKPPHHLPVYVQTAIINKHNKKQEMQAKLRAAIATWAGYCKQENMEDSEIYRLFYFSFGIDILTAQTLGANDAEKLTNKITKTFT